MVHFKNHLLQLKKSHCTSQKQSSTKSKSKSNSILKQHTETKKTVKTKFRLEFMHRMNKTTKIRWNCAEKRENKETKSEKEWLSANELNRLWSAFEIEIYVPKQVYVFTNNFTAQLSTRSENHCTSLGFLHSESVMWHANRVGAPVHGSWATTAFNYNSNALRC